MLVAIHQPNYLPWCGYFTKMRASDVFVFLDDADVPTGRSFVYRTQVRDERGPRWLSVPTHRALHESIRTIRFAEGDWARSHLAKLQVLYRKTPFFKAVMDLISPFYGAHGERLADFNMQLIKAVATYLGLKTEFRVASELGVESRGDTRLVELVQRVGGTAYLSGKGGQKYQLPATFETGGIDLVVREYRPIPYTQPYPAFIGGLSILDAMFNCGKEAVELLRYSTDSREGIGS